jgi:hypothetical protein
MIALFNRFQIKMTMAEALECSHRGACDHEVECLEKEPHIQRQFDKIPMSDIQAELKEYGAWCPDELNDSYQNRLRILWIAACNIREENPRRGTR